MGHSIEERASGSDIHGIAACTHDAKPSGSKVNKAETKSSKRQAVAGEATAKGSGRRARKVAAKPGSGSDPLQIDAADAGVEKISAEPIEDVPEVSRKVRRRRRRTRPRSKTIAMKRLTREELRIGALLYPPVDDAIRPQTRAECASASERPCPWVACKHHLYLDVNPETGSIKINFPDLEPWELQQTCALDVAEKGGITLEEVGEIMNLTRERIRQVEVRGLRKIRAASPSPEELGAALLRGEEIEL